MIGAFLAIVTLLTHGLPQAPATADLFEARERALAAALTSRNRSMLEAALAEQFVMRASPDIDRQQWIDNAVALCWGDRAEVSDFSARQLGRSVVTTFVLTFYVDPSTCQPAVLRSLVTDVWTETGGEWALAVRHAGPVPAAGIAGQFGTVPQPPPTWRATGELSLLAASGNSSARTVGATGDATHRTSRNTTDLHAGYLTSSADGVTRARSTNLQARHAFELRKQVALFARGAYARDRFAGIAHREAVELGLSYTPPLPPRHALTAEGGAGFTSESRIGAEALHFATASGAIRYGWKFRVGSEIQEVAALTADLQDGANWRATNGLSVIVSMTTMLSLKVSSAVEYRHMPVPGFGRTDTRTGVALVVAFERRD